jgi:hypothetical protein
MYNGLLHLHNLMRWIILILLFVAFYRHLLAKARPFTSKDKKIGMFLMISCDITLLIGIYQWISGSFGLKLIQAAGMGAVMKERVARFWGFEHAVGMLIAIVLVHIGYSYAKKNIDDSIKHKRSMLFYGLALLIILISIPWPFRELIGRPWFPGM